MNKIFKQAIAHAVKTGNKRLMNQMELEAIKTLQIQPVGKDHDGFIDHPEMTPIAIGEKRDLVYVKWIQIENIDCEHCGGDGEIEDDEGVIDECLCCYGKQTHEVGEPLITDIDGNILDQPEYAGVIFDDFKERNPFFNFLKMKKQEKAEV